MGEYIIQDFIIVSSECDYQLFFSSDYQRVVTVAINKIMERVEYSEKLELVAHKSFIEIRDSRLNPTIHEIEMLEDYKPDIDCKSFNLGIIAIPQ